MTDPTRPAYDVLGLGNAIVDVIAETDERTLERLDLAKGTMTLIDRARMTKLYAGMGPAIEMSGGSCANTMAALASLGAAAAYVGKVQDDQLGEVFRHDIRATGVDFRTPPLRQGPPTARCLVFVTRDAQRTMATYLGACVELQSGRRRRSAGRRRRDRLSRGLPVGPARRQGRVPEGGADRAPPRPQGRAQPVRSVLRRPLAHRVRRPDRPARRHPDRQRDGDLQPVRHQRARAGRRDGARPGAGRRADLQRRGLRAGERRATHRIAAAPVAAVVDSTGAGDLYAAGLLYGLARDLPLPACGRLGSLAAAEVLGHFGARPKRPLAAARRRAQRRQGVTGGKVTAGRTRRYRAGTRRTGRPVPSCRPLPWARCAGSAARRRAAARR